MNRTQQQFSLNRAASNEQIATSKARRERELGSVQ
jgi:hypothetical protein